MNRMASTREAAINMVVRLCPITNGLPTKMTKRSFDILCTKHRKNKTVLDNGGSWGFLGITPSNKYCKMCKGKKPKELEFIDES